MSYIEIKNLTKIYPKSENHLPALNDVSLSINNIGLVFITGKSGSGKSTLLNLIGGLDSPTSGDIIIKGRSYSSFKEDDFNNLRRNEVGFVFQDFSLVDNLSVFDNIKLASTIKDEIVDKNKVYDAIKEVGLEGYENHLTKDLSAGQRQRVAIARAIIKSPEVLLCDEPTGNLDFVTSHEILNIIKKISKKSLVILVSHNLEDAYMFADRIIELASGQIISDKELTNEELIVKDTAYISGIDFISKDNLANINEGIASGSIKQIKSKKELFVDYQHKNVEYTKKSYQNRHISLKKSFELMNSLLKKQFLKIILFAFVGGVLASMFAVCFMFVNYTPEIVYSQVAEQAEVVSNIFRKNMEDSYYPYGVSLYTNKDINTINKQIGNEPYYHLINIHPFYSDSSSFDNATFPVYDGSTASGYYSVIDKNLYIKETVGVLITTEDYFLERYNLNEITYLAKADVIEKEGVYLTDFIVDQYIARKKLNTTYSDYVGLIEETFQRDKYTINRYYINGIIKTDYLEKYETVINELNRLRTSYPGGLKDYQSSKEFNDYLFDIYSNYICGYSFNPDFLKDYQKSSYHNYLRAAKAKYFINISEEETVAIHDFENTSIGNVGVTSKLYNYKEGVSWDSTNTIYYPLNIMNSVFASSLSAEEWNARLASDNSITIKLYDPVTSKLNFEKTYKIVVHELTNVLLASQNVINDLSTSIIGTSDIVFKNQNNIRHVFSKIAHKGYISINISPNFPKHISKGVEIYIDFFKILLSFSLVALLAIISFVSYNNVRRFTYEIGVTKSLGASLSDVIKIFSLQELYLLLSSIIFAIGGTFIATALSNYVLKSAFDAGWNPIYNINILFVDYKVILVVTGIMILTSLIAMIVPFIKMKNLKPISILKSKY